jgi:hypothetical protein
VLFASDSSLALSDRQGLTAGRPVWSRNLSGRLSCLAQPRHLPEREIQVKGCRGSFFCRRIP